VEPAFPFSIQKDSSAGPGLFRLLLVLGGVVRLLNAGRIAALPPDTLLIIPPGAGCRLLKDAGADIRSICFGRSLVDPLALNGSVDLVVEMLGTLTPSVVRLSGREREDARALFSSMERESSARTPGFQGMMRLKLMEAILMLARARRGSPATGSPTPTGLQAPLRFHPDEAMQYIQSRSADQLSLSELSARYGLNPSYFSRLFRSHAGVSLVEYINRIRIQKSCLLLKRSDASIVEIAFAVGYNNLSHFNRYFRRIMGKSPREYRNFSKR